jgi:DNA-binding NarL/FixJ family response regulator
MTVLVVDDDASFRAMLVALLESAGFAALDARDGVEAMNVARRSRLDAAIIDVVLPGVSGYEVSRQLRDVHFADLPVVFVSGSRVDSIDRAAGMLVGGDDYLVKPVDPDEFLARMRRLLERSRSWAPAQRSPLSEREIEVLQLIAEGLRPADVARRLVISPKTVSSHVQRILTKLGVHTRAQAVAVAYASGLIRVSPDARDIEAHGRAADAAA